ncbi:HmuY protein [Capnocytophaga haemolytica]|uniref:HmuY protein n=2 Tax=Capnocytophaga haemolytica TaxID=45243 RepID=A0AAX2GYR8_9FLAO|nr:HmuY family protein [Capnocytophaga haemolytica]SFN95841.1 HmuY protein [Capnocytophaga haemolytica]SNV12292.1 Uncharacterised protein [Capnocytophaga haemolytica]
MKICLLLPALFAGAMMFTACSKDDDKPLPPNLGIVQPEAQDKGNGVKEVQYFNAENDWAYFSFESGKAVQVDNPRTSGENWDIALKREYLKTNGGKSGVGNAEVVNTNETDFAKVTKYPAEGYVKDVEETVKSKRPGAPDETFSHNKTFDAWYDYDVKTHILTSKKEVYVVKTAKGKYVKFQITDYYNATKKGAYYTFQYKELTEAAPVDPKTTVNLDFAGTTAKEITLDATKDWVYFSLKEGKVVSPTTPEKSTDWDIAFYLYGVKTNGGESGTGKGGVIETGSTDFDTVTQTTITNFVTDKDGSLVISYRPYKDVKAKLSPLMSGYAGQGIVNINPNNMQVYGPNNVYGPTKNVYVIRTADGTYAKVQVIEFYKKEGDKYLPFFPKLRYQLSNTKAN